MDWEDWCIYGIGGHAGHDCDVCAGHVCIHNVIQAHKISCINTIFLCAWTHTSAKLGLIKEIKVCMDLGEHTEHVWAHNITQTHMLACMQTKLLHA